MWTPSLTGSDAPGMTEMMRIWTPMPASASQPCRSRRSPSALRRPRARGTLSTHAMKTSPRIMSQPASAREALGLAPTNVQSLSFLLVDADEPCVSGFRITDRKP